MVQETSWRCQEFCCEFVECPVITRRDASGMVTGTRRVLTIKGNGTVPVKGWRVEVRGATHRIAAVMPLAPGGVDLLFDLELEQ